MENCLLRKEILYLKNSVKEKKKKTDRGSQPTWRAISLLYFPRKKTLLLVCGTEPKIWHHWKWKLKKELTCHLKDKVVAKMLGTKIIRTRSTAINKIMWWKWLCFQVIFSVNPYKTFTNIVLRSITLISLDFLQIHRSPIYVPITYNLFSYFAAPTEESDMATFI